MNISKNKDDVLELSDPTPIVAPPTAAPTAIVVPSDEDVRVALAQAPADATPESVRAALIAANGDLGGAVAILWNVNVSAPKAERTEQQKIWDDIRKNTDAIHRLRNAYGVPRGAAPSGRTTI